MAAEANGHSTEKKNLRIVFMGTPEFAVASLDALINAHFTVVAVITAPDKPAGRGMKITESAVKRYAREKGLRVLQPVKLKDPEFLEELKSLKADVQVVVAFRMLPELVWNMPPLGTINVHGSLLPQYRGAAPINWAIINGEKETGVTTFRLQHEIDTGNILLQEKMTIGEDETAGEIHDRMKELGAKLLVVTLQKMEEGSLVETVQSVMTPASPPLKRAPKIFTDTCLIDWNRPVNEIYNLIRGLSPYPAAFTMLDHKSLKIFRAKKKMTAPLHQPGSYESDGKSILRFAAQDGYIEILELQLEGKKRMMVDAFLRGYRI